MSATEEAVSGDLDTGFDLGASLEGIASKMGLEVPGADEEPVEAEVKPEAAAADAGKSANPADPAAPAVRAPPKSWAKEKHEMWSKLPVDAQDYYEQREKQFHDGIEQYKGEAGFGKQLREVIAPYKAHLAAQGITEHQAVQHLMNTHYQLTNGTAEERARVYQQIGRDLGLVPEQAPDPDAPIDPNVQKLQGEVREMRAERTAEQQQRFNESRARADTETNAFASDPANAYFSEVANDMVPLVKIGHSLKEAYTKAVWGNPVTREKELARIRTEADANLRKKAETEAETARKATSTNVRTAETRRAPTEPKGKMYEDMHETLAKIRARH